MSTSAVAETEQELNRAIDELRGMATTELNKSNSNLSGNLSRSPVTMQIPVEVNIVLGSAEMSVAELSGLSAGSTIQLDKRIGEPVDVVVNGVKIARGELVLLETDANRFGFRISEIL